MRLRLLFTGALVLGCLPADTRPPPATVDVTFRAADSVDGVDTSDGWHVTFDRVLVGLGRPSLDGDGCTSYSESDYFRLLDGKNKVATKLGITYGLGTCVFSFRLRSPDSDTILGEGVSEDDRYLLRTAGDDVYTKGFGVSVLLRGSATKASVTKRFDWLNRHNRIRLEKCSLEGKEDAGTGTDLALASNDQRTIELRFHGETILQDLLVPEKSRLRFDPIAAADADGDGAVTFDELDKILLADIGVDTTELTTELADAATWKTLGRLIYDGLMPRMVRPDDGGRCETSIPPPRD